MVGRTLSPAPAASAARPALRALGPEGSGRPPPRRVRVSVGGWAGLAIVALLTAVALVGPAIVPADPNRQDLLGRLAPPLLQGGDLAHPFGTDALGRDLLARLVAGARVSLTVGAAATVTAGVIGVVLGLIAGVGGGAADRLVSFAVDVQMATPFVVVAIGVVATLGHGVGNVVAVLAITGWVGYARIVRAQATALRRAPFIEAARAIGVGPGHLLTRHVLPNIAGPIIVVASQQVGAMILYEAALGYLGLGVPPATTTWGGMVADGRETLLTAWWVSTIPGLAIALTVLGLNLVGDWLQDALDPASRR